jgi:hypothetical protein
MNEMKAQVDFLKQSLNRQVKSITTLRGQDNAISLMELEMHELEQRLVQSKILLAHD